MKLIVNAEDFALLIEAPNAYQCGKIAEQELARIARLSESHSLTFFVLKITSIYFRKLRCTSRKSTLYSSVNVLHSKVC